MWRLTLSWIDISCVDILKMLPVPLMDSMCRDWENRPEPCLVSVSVTEGLALHLTCFSTENKFCQKKVMF